MQKHRGAKKALLIAFAVLVAAAAVVAFWQWDNIQALRLYQEKSSVELSNMVTALHERQTQALASYGDAITARDLTPEQEAAVVVGELSVQDALGLVGGADTSSPIDVTQGDPAEITNFYLTQIYQLKAEFLGRLGGLYDEALSVWKDLPAEKRTADSKRSLGMEYTIRAYNMEAECDARMDGLLAALETDLNIINADTAVLDEIRAVYAEEKSVRKAYYLSLLNE